MGLKFSLEEDQNYKSSQRINDKYYCVKTCKDPNQFSKNYCTFISNREDDIGVKIITYTNKDRVEAGHKHYENQVQMHGIDFNKYVKFTE